MKTKTKPKRRSAESEAAPSDAPAAADSTENNPPPAPGEFKIVPRDKVRPDPNQPRKVFDPAKLEELAASIKEQGIIVPLVVQLMPAKLKIHPPDLVNSEWQAVDSDGAVVFSGEEGHVKMLAAHDAEEFYQLVFGERRWRAAKIAGLKEVPVIVRELTDREVFVQQYIENQARENLSHLEEAKAFQARLEKEREKDATFNADKLADALKISRSTVYNRLNLLKCSPPVIEALEQGKIQPTVAGLIAMIPNPNAQEKLLKVITNENDWRFPYSFRDVEEIIEADYCKQLKDAPFDLHDADLVGPTRKLDFVDGQPMDGEVISGGACATCPRRSGNMRDAFPHIKNLNVCTDPKCYQQKITVYFAAEAEKVRNKGGKVLELKEFKRVKDQHVAADDYVYTVGQSGTWKDLLGKKAPEPVMVVTEQGLKPYFAKDEAIAFGRKNGIKFHGDKEPQTPEQKAKAEAKAKEQSANLERRERIAFECLPKLAKGLAVMKDKDAWNIVAELIEYEHWTDEEREQALVTKAKSSKAKALGWLYASNAMKPVDRTGDWSEVTVRFWKLAGVDLIAEEKKWLAVNEPALPLSKAKPQQRELLMVKRNKKKGKKGGG